MNWIEAIEEMKKGKLVRRKSEMYMRPDNIQLSDDEEIPVFESGMEACRLVAAWTIDNKPVTVFQGWPSKEVFIPEDEFISATDWIVVSEKDA